jgi:hypothetical protein
VILFSGMKLLNNANGFVAALQHCVQGDVSEVVDASAAPGRFFVSAVACPPDSPPRYLDLGGSAVCSAGMRASNSRMPDGAPASGNRYLVEAARQEVEACGLAIADADTLRSCWADI